MKYEPASAKPKSKFAPGRISLYETLPGDGGFTVVGGERIVRRLNTNPFTAT
ncbi:MAG: hypothetical protein IPK15_22480 [Verrucomicrobia bacterium]|nr:hypothetical protein [Verrucomicrobiota bacterium]